MYAIMKAGGHQYKVKPGDFLDVDYHVGEEGDSLKFDEVLMLGGDKLVLGEPLVEGASVEAVIKKQTRDPKIIVFQFRRRKDSKKKRGFKRKVTQIEIKKINS